MAQKQHEWHQHLGGNTDYAELRYLQVELMEVVDWFPLGVQLNIPTYVLEAIRLDHRTVESCRLNMLIKWGQLEQPTWTKLIKALNNIGNKRLAKEIAERYGSKHSSIAEQPLTNTTISVVEPMDETEQGLLYESSHVVASQPRTKANLGTAFGQRLETDAEQNQDVELASYPLPREPGSEASNGQDPNSQDIKMEDIQVVDTVLLGSGSFGCVKKVWYKGNIYAAKYFYQKEGTRDKVKKEAGILLRLQRLQHRNIVRYIGANTTNDEPVLVMELLQMSLQKYLEENPEVPLLMMLRLLHDVVFLHPYLDNTRNFLDTNIILCINLAIRNF